MAKLSASQRDDMPASTFAGPGRSFPLNDKVHDRMAISGATRSEHAGNISASTADKIKAEARAKLGNSQTRQHSLAMASADTLHKAGYISTAHKDAIRAHAGGKLQAHKAAKATPAFGSLAPAAPMDDQGSNW